MVANFSQLAKNYRFGFKLIELLLAFICLLILIHDEINLFPRWLWLICCTNSSTYIVVLIALSASYISEENCEYLDLVFSVIGVPLYSFAGISSIIRWAVYIPADANNDSYELALGIISMVSASLMIIHVARSMCINHQRTSEETAH